MESSRQPEPNQVTPLGLSLDEREENQRNRYSLLTWTGSVLKTFIGVCPLLGSNAVAAERARRAAASRT